MLWNTVNSHHKFRITTEIQTIKKVVHCVHKIENEPSTVGCVCVCVCVGWGGSTFYKSLKSMLTLSPKSVPAWTYMYVKPVKCFFRGPWGYCWQNVQCSVTVFLVPPPLPSPITWSFWACFVFVHVPMYLSTRKICSSRVQVAVQNVAAPPPSSPPHPPHLL